MNPTTPAQGVIDSLQTILDATVSEDYDLFTTVGDANYKAGITKQMFEGVCEQLAPRMKRGYSTTYSCQLKQGSYRPRSPAARNLSDSTKGLCTVGVQQDFIRLDFAAILNHRLKQFSQKSYPSQQTNPNNLRCIVLPRS